MLCVSSSSHKRNIKEAALRFIESVFSSVTKCSLLAPLPVGLVSVFQLSLPFHFVKLESFKILTSGREQLGGKLDCWAKTHSAVLKT